MALEFAQARSLALDAFYNTSRVAQPEKGLTLTAAALVGMLLHICLSHKAALDVARGMPDDPIWGLVRHELTDLVEAESRETMAPPMAAGGIR